MITACTAMGITGIGAFAGTAAAWDRNDVDFKGCSEVWIIVGPDDVTNDPPVVARVVFGLPDGSTECRDVEIGQANTQTIPGQYGDAPVRKVFAGEDERVLGVIIYEYHAGDPNRFSTAACMFVNDHTCAMTPDTPSVEDADCWQAALTDNPPNEPDGYLCDPISKKDDEGQGPPTNGYSETQSLKSKKNKNK